MIALLLVGCSSPGPSVAPDPTWIDALTEPAFAALIERDGREGWVALHAGRPDEAWAAMQSDEGRHRAALDARLVYEALASVHTTAARALGEEWPDAPPEVRAAAAHATDCSVAPDDPVLAARFAARAAPDPGPVWTLEADGFTRTIHDPCAEAHAARLWAEREGPVEGLAGQVFGPVAFESGPRTAQGARDDLMALRRQLDLGAAARPDAALAEDLAADDVAAVHTATRLAIDALEAGDAEYARTLLQLAHSGGHVLSAQAPERYWAALAWAELASGNPRGALDALAVLGPRAAGPRETVADLAVLRGLSRVGDSKEE
ncbi:MAG: hypothetical protein H6737_25275 [Alphaproteobacteria bacterium]|nr:hypothetical protein [Alphaproteobacteria bacterium]